MAINFESEVMQVKQETQDVKSILFSVPPDFSYKAASHVVIELQLNGDSVGKKQMKSFSIASSPTETQVTRAIEISKKITDSEYSQAFVSLKKGDRVRILGPYGKFLLHEDRNALMIAGGIGITPLRNMIRYTLDKKLPIKITLLYSNRTSEDIAYKGELDKLSAENDNLKIIYTITQPEESKESNRWNGRIGRIDENLIKNEATKLSNPIFYTCGSPSMVNENIELLKKLGVQEDDMWYERFTGYE